MRKLFNWRTLTMFCVIAFFGLLAAGSGDDSSSSDSSSSFTSKQAGEKVTITTYTIGCYSKSDEDEVLKMLNHYDGDDTYFNELVAEGKAITISEGTEVQIIDKKFGMLKVNAPGGTVWISTSCVK